MGSWGAAHSRSACPPQNKHLGQVVSATTFGVRCNPLYTTVWLHLAIYTSFQKGIHRFRDHRFTHKEVHLAAFRFKKIILQEIFLQEVNWRIRILANYKVKYNTVEDTLSKLQTCVT